MAEWWDRANDIIDARRWSRADVARRISVPEDRLYKWLQGEVAQPRGDAISKLAVVLGVHEYWLRTGKGPRVSSAQLVGYISAGEEFYPIDDFAPGAGFEDVTLSLDVADPIAIRVRGSSMSPVYRNGDDLFCSRERGVSIESVVGRDCVVLTKDGAGYVKQLRPGNAGRFTLRSYNPAYEDIENVDIEWAAPIMVIRRA